MKRTFLTLGIIILLQALLFGQIENDIISSVNKVIVFTKGAQIEREANVSLQQGQMILKLINLSPYIDEESIRVTGDGSYIIQNVQIQNDYLNELEKSKEIELLKKKIEEFKIKIEEEETWIGIFNDKLDFLKSNKKITSNDQIINPEVFNSLNSIYGNNLELLNFDILKKNRQIKNYREEIKKLNSQLNSQNSKSDLPSGTVIITIHAKQTKKSKIKLNYLVDKAKWYPSYDIRFTGLDKLLSITFKANINQNTGIDWKDVNLVLSTTKTDVSAQMPKIIPNYLQFYYPKVSNSLQGRVAGLQISKSEIPENDTQILLRGVRSITSKNEALIIIDGNISTSNEFDSLNPDDISNMEVLKNASATALYGSQASNGAILITTKKNKYKSSIPLTITSKQETSNEYIVDAKQTILSTNKINIISFREIGLDAIFEYQSAPKLAENAYLIGKISDWYKAELIDGEASIYLENSYVGKSFINTKQFKDTLEMSFGIDNNISIKREKLFEYTENKIIGQSRKETLSYKLTVRNNKLNTVNTKIIDQIPVSTTKDIQIEVLELSNGDLNSDTGKVEWKVELKPNETKEILIKFSVRYPKEKKVIID